MLPSRQSGGFLPHQLRNQTTKCKRKLPPKRCERPLSRPYTKALGSWALCLWGPPCPKKPGSKAQAYPQPHPSLSKAEPCLSPALEAQWMDRTEISHDTLGKALILHFVVWFLSR